MQNNFSTTAFGGFKKEEVAEYIDSLIKEHEDELNSLKDELNSLKDELFKTNEQLDQFKAIVEEQYSRIVDATEEAAAAVRDRDAVADEKNGLSLKCEALMKSDTAQRQRLSELSSRLQAYNDEKQKARDIVETARLEADKLANEMKQKIAEAAGQVKIMVDQATNKSNGIIAPARDEADKIIENARSTAREILNNASAESEQLLNEAKGRIENTISLNEENEERSRRLVEAAKREGEEIIKRAAFEANEEKGHYESCLKALDGQKTKLIAALDEIKQGVSSIKIGRTQKSEKEIFAAIRENTTEALRKKFTLMNKDRPNNGGGSNVRFKNN